MPVEFARPTLLSSYCEWAGKMPASSRTGRTNHMQVLSDVARRVELLLQKK